MMKTFVLYHASCSDGHCAAWIARRALGMAPEYIPVQHNEPPPAIPSGSSVYILDFSYPRDVMATLCESHKVVCLDHHLSAQKALDGFADEMIRADLIAPTIVFDMQKSGAHLTWDYCVGEDGFYPGVVAYTEDRDLWRFDLPHSRAVNACIHSYPMCFDEWDTLFGTKTIEEMCEWGRDEGYAILRAEQRVVDSHVKNAQEVTIAGHKVLAVNATTMISEIAGALAIGRAFGACWFDKSDGKRIWSFRSAPDGIDVSEIAKSFDGGGHRNSAGATMAIDPIDLWMRW